MQSEALRVRDLLNQELERRSYVSGMPLKVEELFEKAKAKEWISKLIGKTHANALEALMDKATGIRLGHAAATYLLGVAVRDRFQIPFDLLPRFITSGSCDGFQFFWALICLCHDLGYYFEHAFKGNQNETDKMNSEEDRKALFGIKYDLLALEEEELKEICDVLGPEYSAWISEARKNIQGYDLYRRKVRHTATFEACIDHGIAGAILLYDLMRKEYEQRVGQIQNDQNVNPERGRHTEQTVGLMDSVSDRASAKRFLACGLWIACTVGRHNMWVAGNAEADKIYEGYGLTMLRYNQKSSLVRADSNLEQMLFLLDFLDTIDPVKGIYVRAREDAEFYNKQEEQAAELNERREFLLDHVKIRFAGDYTDENDMHCRWGNALTYRKIEIFAEGISEEDQDKNQRQRKYFNKGYVSGTQGMHTWLRTRAPQIDEENCKATYYLPAHRSRGNVWPYGITDDEVDALLLYEGCGVPGKYGEFYSPAEAYQTFNLLMMPGQKGEEVRILKEKQTPRSFYITHWVKTLDVMLDIFTAQCKYARGKADEKCKLITPLHRSDRAANVELMEKAKGTFAFTSTSLKLIGDRFLVDKEEPQYLIMELGDHVPYLDYAGFFGNKYVFSDEWEVLLPPLVKTEIQKHGAYTVGEKSYPCYSVQCTGFDIERAEQMEGLAEPDEYELIGILEKDAGKAAETLKKMTNQESALPDKDDPYWAWKEAFQKLTLRCMGNIYKRYFGTN